MSTTWLFGLAALVVAGAIAAALFGLPVRTWFDQDSELQALEHELTEMQAVNHDLQGEVDRLQTDDGIREAARRRTRSRAIGRQAPDDARAATAAHRPARRLAVLAGRGDPRRARRAGHAAVERAGCRAVDDCAPTRTDDDGRSADDGGGADDHARRADDDRRSLTGDVVD